MIIYTIKI